MQARDSSQAEKAPVPGPAHRRRENGRVGRRWNVEAGPDTCGYADTDALSPKAVETVGSRRMASRTDDTLRSGPVAAPPAHYCHRPGQSSLPGGRAPGIAGRMKARTPV